MDLSVRDVARLLQMSESTVYRLVRTGQLPAYRLHDQYRFNRVEIHEWALEHGVKLDPDLLIAADANGALLPEVADALERGGIYHAVPGATRNEVLRNVAYLPGIPGGVDRGLLHHLLVTREALGSTGVGDGIAIPHPRSPLVLRVDDPIVLLCFLEQPVDFQAVDGQPVQTLFTLLSPTIQVHLQTLAKVAHLLHDRRLKDLLRSRAASRDILERVRVFEEQRRRSAAPRSDG